MELDRTMELEVTITGSDNVELIRKRFAVTEKQQDRVRMCWLNRYGTVDYYTFSPVQRRTVSAVKNRITTGRGTRTAHVESEYTATVQSPFLPASHVGELSGIVTSPRVWLVNGLEATEVDIISGSVDIDSEGPQKLEITYRVA